MELPRISTDARAGISADVAALLDRAQAEITALNPKCDASGRCCRFEEYGHRLYITMAELIHFSSVMTEENHARAHEPSALACARTVISLPQFFADAQPRGCPYQVGRLCQARDARPLGCRIYFCDPGAQSWQNTLYERYHAELKAIHIHWDVEYSYIEWRAALSMALHAGWLPSEPDNLRTK